MRLLAYGGTSFVVRCRMGEWPEVPEGALSDTYYLSTDRLAYGVGLLAGQSPYLIIRQRQNVQNRGGYAYTLLLEPDEAVWRQFGMNAARLVVALFGEGRALAARLMESPEGLTHEEIETALSGLHPSAEMTCPHPTADLCSLLVGAALQSGPVVVSPRDAGFSAPPTPECMAVALDHLPLPFRAGYGWLVGGSGEQGRAFGVRLIFDEGEAEGGEVAHRCLSLGRQALADWREVSQHSPEAIQNHAQLPLWKWSLKWKSPAVFLEAIGVLARGIRSKTPEDTDKFVRDTEDAAYKEGPLAEYYRRQAILKMRANKNPLSQIQTRRILQEYFNNALELTPEEVGRFHPQTVVEWFIERKQHPDRSSAGISLGWPVRYEIWRRLVAEVVPESDVVATFKAAVTDLTDDPEPPEDFDLRVGALAELAVARTARGGLLGWLGARSDEVLGLWVCGLLERETRRHAAERRGAEVDGDWPLEYVAFVSDPGGELLADQYLDSADTKRLVDALLGQIKGDGPLADESRRWLQALACSRLRADLPPQSKFDIAKEGVKGWQWLNEMWRLFHDQLESAESAATITEAERERLRAELRELARPNAIITTVPNLRGLAALLGPLPEEDVRALASIQVPTSLAKAPQWLEGFRALGREEIYQSKLADMILKTRAGSYEQLPLDQLDDVSFRAVVDTLLFEGSDQWDAELRDRLVRLLTLPTTRDRAAAVLNSVFASAPAEDARARTWARRFGADPEAAEEFFGLLDSGPQANWVAGLARHDGEQFGRRAGELLYPSSGKDTPLSPYGRAVLNFLRTDEGAWIKEQVATDQHSFIRARNVEQDIAARLGEDAKADAPAGEPTVVKLGPRRKKWGALLQPYLPPIIHSRLFRADADPDSGEASQEAGGQAAAESSSSTPPGDAAGPEAERQEQPRESARVAAEQGDAAAGGATQGR